MGEDLMVRQPQYRDARCAHPPIAFEIPRGWWKMRGAIGFHHETGGIAEKVGDEGTERLLASKLRAVESPTSKKGPQSTLRWRLPATKDAGSKGRLAQQPHE